VASTFAACYHSCAVTSMLQARDPAVPQNLLPRGRRLSIPVFHRVSFFSQSR